MRINEIKIINEIISRLHGYNLDVDEILSILCSNKFYVIYEASIPESKINWKLRKIKKIINKKIEG